MLRNDEMKKVAFGVNDNEELVGRADSKDTSEKISEIIKTKMDPIPQVIIEKK